MPQEVTLLHISDLHMDHEDDNNADRNEIIENFIEAVVHFLNQTPDWIPNFIVVTGDISNRGLEKDFDVAKEEFFDKLIDSLQKNNLMESVRIIVVPGNHDKDMLLDTIAGNPLSKSEIEEYLGNKKIDEEKHKEYLVFLKSKSEKERSFISTAGDYFANFDRFCGEITCIQRPKTVADDMKKLKNHNIFTYGIHEFEDFPNLSFCCVNSALFSISGFADYGRLLLQQSSIRRAKKYIEKKNNDEHIVVTLMHHPPSWLQEQAYFSFPNERAIYSELSSFSSVILCGHTHNSQFGNVDILRNTPNLMTGSIYKKKTPEKKHWNSFSFVKINKKDNILKIRLFEYEDNEGKEGNPWRELSSNGGYEHPLSIGEDYSKMVAKLKELEEKNFSLKIEVDYLLNKCYPDRRGKFQV